MGRACRSLLLWCVAGLPILGLSGCFGSCLENSTCGNGIAEGSEDCDGRDLRGRTCANLTLRPHGDLACTSRCMFNRSGCTLCGDLVAEGSEQCDGWDLGGLTCESLVPGSRGYLMCTRDCTLDLSDCTVCGDGLRQAVEQCDCGTDASNLPSGCTDANGGAEANCSDDCLRIAYCGDGRLDTGEECDCGTDASNLPSGCPEVNGGPEANCTADCEVPCRVESYYEECDPYLPNDCCEDEWGVQPVCFWQPGGVCAPICARGCTSTMDCFWSHSCASDLGGICWTEPCGLPDWPNAQANAFCTVPGVSAGGGGLGWCWPQCLRSAVDHPLSGLCIEAGTLAHGAQCDFYPWYSIDRSVDTCHMGICSAPDGEAIGKCRQFCDWEAAYSVAFYGADPGIELLPCPAGAGCFPSSYIDPNTGLRSADMALCLDTLASDPEGLTTCSLVTGQLLSSPASTCLDAGFTHGRCVVAVLEGGQGADGSLIGVCADGPAAPDRAVWDLCDSESPADVCPVGSVCERPDLFAPTPNLAHRCVPRCDAAHAEGAEAHCAALGAMPTIDGTPFCQSISRLFPPYGPSDTLPTRLGLCGL